MKMKSKITMGLGFLFLLVFLISGLSIYYIGELSSDAKAILKDNYRSLEYVREMTASLNTIKANYFESVLRVSEFKSNNSEDYQKAFANFENYLKAEENNITEPGEKELAGRLRNGLRRLVETDNSISKGYDRQTVYLYRIQPVFSEMDSALTKIHAMNMKAILTKNEKAKVASDHIIASMSVLTAICLALAIIYYFFFPNYVSFTLMVLSERMKDIASGKYDQRLNLKSGDEFGEISESFDKLVEHLQQKEKNA